MSPAHGSGSNIDDLDYYRKVRQFNQMHPSKRPSLVATASQFNNAHWSDPASADEKIISQPIWPISSGGEETARAGTFMPPPMSSLVGKEGRIDLGLSREISKESVVFEHAVKRIPPRGQKLKRLP